MKHSMFKRWLAGFLCAVLLLEGAPTKVLADTEEFPETESQEFGLPEMPAVINTGEGEVKVEDDWVETYPYGAFAFGNYQSDIAEPGALTDDGQEIPAVVRIPVYRVGGASGKATAKITYMPAVTMGPDGQDYIYDYAASGKRDVRIRYEDPKVIAQYQAYGMPDELRNMEPSDTAVVFAAPEGDVDPKADVTLVLSEDVEAESYQWQVKDAVGWKNVRDAADSTFPTAWEGIWNFDTNQPRDIDYRCIYVKDGAWYCTESLHGETYEKIPEVPVMPEELPEEKEPSYSELVFEEDYDSMIFDLTFADGETVKYIEVEAMDDEETELPQMGLFTIAGCVGGELTDLCNTHTVMVSDNDASGPSQIFMETADVRVEPGVKTLKLVVMRSGDTSYNVTVDYTIEDGTARAGVDYAANGGTLSFIGSFTEIEIPIELIDTGAAEDRTFTVKLSNVLGGGTEQLCALGVDETVVTLLGTAPVEDAAEETVQPAEEQTEAPAEEQTEAPAEEQTEAPAEEQTEAPAEEQTEAPAEEQTEAPSEEQSEAPAEEQTEAPSEEQTGELPEESSEEQTQEPADAQPTDEQPTEEQPAEEPEQPAKDPSGKNLATVLNEADGEDLTSKVRVEDDPLIKDTTVTEWNYAGEDLSEELVGELSAGPDTRSHTSIAALKFSRTDITNYSDSGYWKDWEVPAGAPGAMAGTTGEGVNTLNYLSGLGFKADAAYAQGNGITSGYDAYMTENKSWAQSGTSAFRTYTEFTANMNADGKLEIANAGKLFSGYTFGLYFERFGSNGDVYLRPSVSFRLLDANRSDISSTSTFNTDDKLTVTGNLPYFIYNSSETGIAMTQTDADEYPYGGSGRSKPRVIPFNTAFFEMAVSFKEYKQWGTTLNASSNAKIVDPTTRLDLYRLTFQRRVFAKKDGMPVVIYTANDSDEVQSGWAPITDATLYTTLAPRVSIKAGKGGINSDGDIYVGTTLTVDCTNSIGFSVRQTDGVYLTNDAKKIVARGKATSTDGVWELTLLWDDLTEADLTKSYQINVVYDRTQPIKIDIAPSVPRQTDGINIDTTKIAAAWDAFFANGKQVTAVTGVSSTSGTTGDTDYKRQDVPLKKDKFDNGNGAGVFATNNKVKNVQAINLGQDADDVILFKGHAYKGNDTIPLNAADIASEELVFYFYDSAYLDSVSTMVANFDHADLYYDGDGDHKISGTFSGGVFTVSGADEYVGVFKGEHFEKEFAPKVSEDGETVYQYYIKAVYTLRPRSLKIPAGASSTAKAQVFPVFLSAVTNTNEAAGLTREQKAYRYVHGVNTDGHDMYGADATALSYIDIPLGGDTSVIKRFSVTTAVYDTEGKEIIDTVNTTEYTWKPDYVGSLLVDFDNPEPIIDDNNVTDQPVPYSGETPKFAADGSFSYSKAGLKKMNGYLGAFAGRTTFGLCVQEQVTAYNSIDDLANIAPESISLGNASSVPNGNSGLNFESADNKDQTEGTTPDGTGFSEFGANLGSNLPSLDFGIGDYVTITMDGTTIGLSVGIPIAKSESEQYSVDDTTTGADGTTIQHYKNDNGGHVYETTRPDGSSRKYTVTTTEDKTNHTKTITKQVEIVKPDGTKGYYNTESVFKTEDGKPDKITKKTVDTNAPQTPPPEKKKNAFKEANGQMGTLKDFIGAVVNRAAGKKGSMKEFFSGMLDDDSLKNAKNGKSTSKKMSVSFTVQLAMTLEYNPIFNKHKFDSAGISGTLAFEFVLQHRFTACPLVYVYVKTGITLELAIGLGVDYKIVEDKMITTFESGDFSSLTKRGGSMVFILKKGFKGFRMTLDGRLYMEVFDHMPAEGDKALTSGMISGDGTTKEVYLSQYKKDVFVRLTTIAGKARASGLRPINVKNKVYFSGVNITPGVSVEAGVGVGVEALHFELYVKTNIAITITFGKYNLEKEDYEPAYVSNFDWNISVGFNLVILFFNYSMDLVAFSVNGQQSGTGGYFTWEITASAANGMKTLWTKTTYTDAHGKTLSSPPDGRSASRGAETPAKVVSEKESLIRVSTPTDVSRTQDVKAVKTTAEELERLMREETEATRAIRPTGTDDFELSGYGTSGDARELITGLTTGYSYKLFAAGGENYIIYPVMIESVPQLVMSRVIMVGDLSDGTGLQNPADAEADPPYVVLDGDGKADYEFGVDVDGTTVTAVWTCEGENGMVVKRAAFDLNGGTAFGQAEILSQDDGLHRYLPEQAGASAVFAEAAGNAADLKQKDELYKAYLILKNPGLTGEVLDSGMTDDAFLSSAVYSYMTMQQMNRMQGTSTTLTAVTDDGTKTALIEDEVVENIETGVIGSRTFVFYTTARTDFYNVSGDAPETVSAEQIAATPAENADDIERAVTRHLYVRELTTDGFGTAKLLQTVIDFEGCNADNLSSAKMKDGVYVNKALSGSGEADPHYANLDILTAKLKAESAAETFLLFEMGSNTYILRDIPGIFGSSPSITLTPIFESTRGTDVTIGSDSENLAVVYTAAVPNTVNNAVFIAWWDTNEGTWGEPNVLAMRHLQVYEDIATYEMEPEDAEKAYLGRLTTPGDHTGSMSRLTFRNLQMSTREVETGGVTKQQLLVLTEGSMSDLQTFSFEAGGETVSAVIPKRRDRTDDPDLTEEIPPQVGFYAIAFGEGSQALGEGSLSLANYDFSSGSQIIGEVSFRNLGTAAIRASDDNPMSVTLTVNKPDAGSQNLAKWLVEDSIPSGGEARLTFTTDPLTADLPTGSTFSLSLTEDTEYFGNNAFSAALPGLLTVEEKAELFFGNFDAEVRAIENGKAVVYVDASVANTGNKNADEVFIQFSYDTGRTGSFGRIYAPIDLTGAELTTGLPDVYTREAVAANAENGVYLLKDEYDGTVIEKGYKRDVYGTILVPVEAFLSTEEISGLHLKAEVYSSADDPNLSDGVYTSDHSEYNQRNNAVTKTLKHETFFAAPSQISTSLGNTLHLPVPYESTGAEPEIVVTEIGNGLEDWEPLMGIAYYDAATKTIVAAANEKAEQMIADGEVPTGILQVKDTATNSIAAVTFRITEMADGVNIYKDDKSFTYYNANGSVLNTDAAAVDQPGWSFVEKVPAAAWHGGETTNEVPMNGDLSRAKEDGASVSFLTTADTMTLYFAGSVTVTSSEFDVTAEAVTSGKASPVKYSFVKNGEGNETGLQHTVTITAVTAGTEIDRYTATYKVSPVVPTDLEAPQILWNRSFPETASVKPDETVPMRCYILDGSGLSKVTLGGQELGTGTTPALVKTDDNLWYFDYEFSDNKAVDVRAFDTAGNTVNGRVQPDWFNTVLTEGAVATAPALTDGDLSLTDDNGSPVTGTAVSTAPWLTSAYTPAENETSSAYLFVDGVFSDAGLGKAASGEKWKTVANGYYQVRVDREDGSWARAILKVDCLDLTEPQLSVSAADGVVSYTASDDQMVASLTVNGMEVADGSNPLSGTLEPGLGGSFTVKVTDNAGNTAEETVELDLPLTLEEGAVDTAVLYENEALTGTAVVNFEKVTGGKYDGSISDPANGVYKTVFAAAAVPKGETPAEEDYVTLSGTAVTFSGLPEGEYEIYVRDSAGSLARWDGTFHVYHPEDEWKDTEYSWADDNKTATAKRQSKLYPEYIQSETVEATSEQTKAPACEEKGETTYTAVFTAAWAEKQTKTEADIAELGHDWGGWTVTKEPTETLAGTRERVCKNDPDHKQTEEIAPLGPPVYTLAKGAAPEWEEGSEKDVTFTVLRNRENETILSHFKSITLNKKKLPADAYKVEDGLKVTIYASTLEEFTRGGYQLIVYFDDGRMETTLTVMPDRLPFKDVPRTSAAYKAIKWAWANGMVKGTDKTHFSPNEDLTRGQFCVILYKMNNSPSIAGMKNPFTDVEKGKGAGSAIIWCYNKKIVTGYQNADGTRYFSTGGKVTRSNIIIMLYKMTKMNLGADAVKAEYKGSPYKDVGKKNKNLAAYKWAYVNSISRPENGVFGPKVNCLRWHLMLFLYRYNSVYHVK